MNKHEKLIQEYAEDSVKMDKPWEQWETSMNRGKDWFELEAPPIWIEYQEYRRKPKVYKINVEFTSNEVYAVGEVIPPNTCYYCVLSGVIDVYRVPNYTSSLVREALRNFKTKEAAQKWLDATK